MKVAIVTGSSSGIGRSIALQLAQLKYSVVLTGRNEKKLAQLKPIVNANDVECLTVAADLENENAAAHIIEHAINQLGQIDLVVNNAGMAHASPISETDSDSWDRIFKINARAPFLLCKKAVPYLKKSEHPVIINIGSVVGFKGYAGQAAYSASKHALTGFTKVLAKEVQDDGISVHLISPGGVNTSMATEMRPDIDTENLILPEEIAELVGFLATRKGRGTMDHFYIRRKNGLAFD